MQLLQLPMAPDLVNHSPGSPKGFSTQTMHLSFLFLFGLLSFLCLVSWLDFFAGLVDEKILGSPGWPQTHFISDNDLELMILPSTASQVLGLPCVPLNHLCDSEDQTQGSLHIRSALHQLSYISKLLSSCRMVADTKDPGARTCYGPRGCERASRVRSIAGHDSQARGAVLDGDSYINGDEYPNPMMYQSNRSHTLLPAFSSIKRSL